MANGRLDRPLIHRETKLQKYTTGRIIITRDPHITQPTWFPSRRRASFARPQPASQRDEAGGRSLHRRRRPHPPKPPAVPAHAALRDPPPGTEIFFVVVSYPKFASNMSAANRSQPIKLNRPVVGKARKLKDLMLKSDNRVCADCSAPDPKWASSNIGVFLCLKCGDVHRALGQDISNVLSLTLDDWSDSDIDSMIEVGGNSYANSIYEAFLPKDHPKPKPDSPMEYRTKFIRAKYETQDFLKPSLRISSKAGLESTNSLNSVDNSFSSTSRKHAPEDTREFVGQLNITVVKGSGLAVRDMLTSDPYVVLSLGEQKAQTTVKASDLNPVWNEVLNLSVPRNYGPLKLEVYDHDTFSADDIMGEAEIDLKPMITAAMAFGDPSRHADMQIGRWFMTRDNCLLSDSIVNISSGKVKQEVYLKLQNVESGEMELELEWARLD
ncbi:hypothetical protein CFC21_093461 [Triticum aestivum]|uniref:ZAC n=3 Tax=Triticinae TaxID=1648030 RepID=A0A3B6QJJ7_WHEAT|nr:ADP-ribosylation factor GTPase-activating protein AGD12 [Aegilops tauschii subsp. strangulata]XP_044420663.1 ADP-ribosylation factor GTPase-activating protein AGD12-like [Triticum aestivum]KAF7090761.1 hypothetical protein CFC21_093461 [Triticum aestivum]